MNNKIANAGSSDWLRQGLTDEEVEAILEEGRDTIFTIDDAIMTCKARAIARETRMEMWEGDDDTYSWVSKKYAEYCQIAEWLEELKMWRDLCKDFNNVCNDKYVVFGGNIRKINCSDCILDLTDACSRGAGRAVSDEVCEDFIGDDEE